MANHAWQFSLDNQPHTVKAEIDFVRGIRSVQLDGVDAAPANDGRFDSPLMRSFALAGHSLQVMKFGGGAALLLDGQPVPNLPGQALPARLGKYEAQRAFWRQLARLTGLEELPRADGLLEWRNRLAGTADNRQVVLNYSVSYQFMQPRIAIFTRYAEEQDLNDLRARIERDPALLDVLRRMRRTHLEMTVQSTGAAILLPYDVRKTTPEQAADDVRTVLNVVKKNTRPLSPANCDWGQCKSAAHPRELVFYNHAPLLVCSACAPLMEKAGEVNRARYRKSVPGTLKAISAGLAVAALAGVFFGVWKFSLVLAIASAALFFAVVGAMNRLKAKRTAGMVWLAGGLTLLGVAVASLMEATLKLMRTLTDVSQVEFGMVFTRPETMRLLGTNLAVAAVILAATLWFALNQQRQAVRELTHPTIEHTGVED